MSKKTGIIIQLLIWICICVTVLTFNIAFGKVREKQESHDEITVSRNWDMVINGVETKNVDLENTHLGLLNRGDEFSVSATLPEKFPDDPVLELYVIHAVIDVYIDGVPVYVYGHEKYDAGKLLGYGYHFISLKESDAGKKLEIKMIVSENEAFSSQDTPIIANGNYLHRDFLVENRTRMAINLFLILLGITVAVFAICYMRKDKNLNRLIAVGLFSASIGCWSLCSSDLIEMFTYNLQVKSFLEYGALYMAPLFISAYFIPEIRNEGRIRWMVYRIILVMQGSFSIFSWILQLCNVVRFPKMLKLSHAIMGVIFLFLIVRFAVDIFKGKVNNSIIVYGFEILAVFAFYDLLRFNILKYYISSHYVSLVYIGVVIFILSLLVDFGVKYIREMYEQIEKSTLEKMAYTDSMTELSNRRAIEEMMDRIDEKNEKYTIVAFDLNDLKKVNDTLGHEEGDRYIKSFAIALKDAFGKFGLVGRNGGDEFTAIISGEYVGGEEQIFECLRNNMDDINRENANWNMTVAYGYCSGEETGITSIRQAAKLADERMYLRKAEMKANRL